MSSPKKKKMIVLKGSIQTDPTAPAAMPGETVELSVVEADSLAAAGVVGVGVVGAVTRLNADNAAVAASQADLEAAQKKMMDAEAATATAVAKANYTVAENAALKEQLASVQAQLAVATAAGGRGVVCLTGDALVDAIIDILANSIRLNPDEDFTSDGAPRVKSLERELGYDITVEDRDAAWSVYQNK